jgi:hypothetical protein
VARRREPQPPGHKPLSWAFLAPLPEHGVDRHHATGMLGGALDVLAVHYGVGAPMPEILPPIGQGDTWASGPPA